MGFKPQHAGGDGWIDLGLAPPRRFIAAAVHLAMMAVTQRDRKFVADLAAERAALCESQVMGVRGLSAANEAGMLCNRLDAITDAPRLGKRQRSLIDSIRPSAILSICGLPSAR
jgi:hypothetical protein